MRILNFEFKNLETGWHLLPSSFDKFNLLVGASGVGKTQILEALVLLQEIVISGETPKNEIEWKIEIELKNKIYIWEGAFEKKQDIYLGNTVTIKYEILKENDIILIDRTAEKTLFNGQPTIKLLSNKSAINLLKEERNVLFFNVFWVLLTFNDYSFSSLENKKTPITDVGVNLSFSVNILKFLENKITENELEIHLKNSSKKVDKTLSTSLALLFIRADKYHLFFKIKTQYINIFPTVEDISFFEIKDGHINTQNSILDYAKHSDSTEYVLCIKEHNVANWIPQQNISSGMWRCLMQLIELQACPDGSVFLIDEFENSLGINCINEITKEILASDRDIQFIITSHHPYIIDNIPTKYWKLVTRNGSDVSFQNVEKLGIGKSKHSAFMQLLQLDAYQTGTFEHD